MAAPHLRIGLTGGIGSGKSSVAASLVALGATLVDTDAIARQLTAPQGAAIPALRNAFGPAAIAADGSLDRERMRTLAFAEPHAMQRLENVMHPLIEVEAARQAQAASGHVLVFDVPLLVESAHWRARVDRVLVVDCSEATQAERVARRAGWTHEAAERVIAQQAPRALRRAIADAVIFNEVSGLDTLEAQVLALWRCWSLPNAVEQ